MQDTLSKQNTFFLNTIIFMFLIFLCFLLRKEFLGHSLKWFIYCFHNNLMTEWVTLSHTVRCVYDLIVCDQRQLEIRCCSCTRLSASDKHVVKLPWPHKSFLRKLFHLILINFLNFKLQAIVRQVWALNLVTSAHKQTYQNIPFLCSRAVSLISLTTFYYI